jgi:hypothetical protein
MADSGFTQGIEQKFHANLAVSSAPVNRNRVPSNGVFPNFYFEFQMPINNIVVGLEKIHNFGNWRF